MSRRSGKADPPGPQETHFFVACSTGQLWLNWSDKASLLEKYLTGTKCAYAEFY
jgi:hypothetical protein